MSRYNHAKKLSFFHYSMRIVFILLGILILSLFCPRESGMQLRYHLGEPWEANALIAKDSFDIHKSEALQQLEKDSLKKRYEPYYEKRSSVKEQQLAALRKALDATEGVNWVLKQTIVNQLAEEYDKGILPDSSYHNLQNREIRFVHLYQGKDASTADARALKSQQMVYKLLMDNGSSIYNTLVLIKLNNYIEPNLAYDAKKSDDQQQDIDRMFTPFAGRVQIGEKIVDKGQIVNQSIYDKLTSYERHENERKKTTGEMWSQLGGQILYITLIMFALFTFLSQFRRDYIVSQRHALLLWILLVVFPLITYLLASREWGNAYIIPYCMTPIFIRVFMDSRMAFITHLASIMLSALVVPAPFVFMVVQILAGLTSIYALKQLQQRSDLFIAVLLVIGTSLLAHLCLDLTNMNFFNTTGVNAGNYMSILGSGLLLFISYLLLFPIEKLFKFTSTVTLVELSNTNNPILRRLSEEAPGTFQHSLQVANLAADVANGLGANAQLVRTGALYHDIGKLKSPAFFTENQNGINPHNSLPFEDSAQIIIQHVRHGIELANKYRLPESIQGFITTHHGRSKAKFFYVSYINQNPDKKVNDEIFTYPGPNPTTLEQAILMMADAVEASSRSLPEYTEEAISSLVNRIIDSQMNEGCFKQCPITFENIEDAKQLFKNKLMTIYHTRISYPELKKPLQEETTKA